MRRKRWQWLLFVLCLSIFGGLRLHSISKRHPPETTTPQKIALPKPLHVKHDHPWLQLQPLVDKTSPEIVRDLEKIHYFTTTIEDLSEDQVTGILIQTLLSLQMSIPFTFPEELYNVLCIAESPHDAPAPFHVFKRLYLDDTELGLPFYLDVRVFKLDTASVEEITEWHLNTLVGEKKTFSEDAYLCYGKRNENTLDKSHGFAALQGERGLFLKFCEKEGYLFVCYAEAPLSVFEKHKPLFKKIL